MLKLGGFTNTKHFKISQFCTLNTKLAMDEDYLPFFVFFKISGFPSLVLQLLVNTSYITIGRPILDRNLHEI